MISPKQLSIQDYTYTLPEERIARYPLAQRDASRLLIYKEGKITEDTYTAMSSHLPAGSLLVFNNTKVVEARLLFQKQTGGIIEIFCLEPHVQYADITTAMLQKGKVLWHCLVGGASKWKPGQVLEKKISYKESGIQLQAKYVEKKTGSFVIELSWQPAHLSFAELLHHAGAIPLPPYIKRAAEESDKKRYQTVYADTDGSVAAPTAGLHFTEKIFADLQAKNIQTAFVTLHVGAGTFKPVKAETMEGHEMHAEWIDVPASVIEKLKENADKDIIAVGTTSLRTIESLYWLGRKPELRSGTSAPEHSSGTSIPEHNSGGNIPERSSGVLTLQQWDPYEMPAENIPAAEALGSLLSWMKRNKQTRLIAKTQLLIAPGYNFKIVKGLITNFHQPQSTLLLLVAALVGDDWKKIYEYALLNDFRFLSYGDGSLLWRKKPNV